MHLLPYLDVRDVVRDDVMDDVRDDSCEIPVFTGLSPTRCEG
jgi:hypothetical protein